MAEICGTIAGFEILNKVFPSHHEHQLRDAMTKKTICHIEPTINFSEMDTSNMVIILEKIQYRWLELMAEKLDEKHKEIYSKAFFDMRSPDVDFERLREAEDTVMDIVEKFGKLVVFGDQLTVIFQLCRSFTGWVAH